MTRVFQMAIDGVGTEEFYKARTAEEALKKFKKDIEEYGGKLDMTAVEAILYDEYED